MLKNEFKMARANIVKGLFLGRRHSTYVAKRGNNNYLFRSSLDISVPGELVEISEHLRGEMSAYAQTRLRERAGNVGFVWVDVQDMAGWPALGSSL